VLDTPWATTEEEKNNAVDGVVRAFGAEPSLLRLGIPRADGGLVGIYDRAGSAVAGYSVAIQKEGDPCGRIASLKFSKTGELGAHLLERVDTAQTFFIAASSGTSRLFSEAPAFVWPASFMPGQTINDMWFSDSTVAIDASGVLAIADLRTGVGARAFELPGAIATGDYFSAEVFGADVFVARQVEGRTEWWVRREGRLEPFLVHENRDMRELVTDGQRLIWVEGREPGPAPADALHPVQYAKYVVMKAPYTTRAADLAPELLVADVPRDFGRLVIANGFATGIYLISYPVYRAGAIVIDLGSHTARRSELPQGYSWGYELYPTAGALLGPVTPGPMLSFETIARVPYETMAIVPPG
jgi:hypothetical protein